MKPTPRPELKHIPRVHHGSLDHQELDERGLAPDDVIDFSVNGNPYGPSPWVKEALCEIRIDRYPDRDSHALRSALAAHHGVRADQVLPGNGSLELLWMLALSYLDQEDRVLILTPTFGEYARAARMMGADVVTCRAEADRHFQPEIKQIERALREKEPKILFLCNPNNPTGKAIPLGVLKRWSSSHPGTLFVVDEAYLQFTGKLNSAIGLHKPNLCVLRSMTKDFSLAGLRLGYAVADPEVIHHLEKVRPPWNVNVYAQKAGMLALQGAADVRRQCGKLLREKENLAHDLEGLGYDVEDSTTHFFLMKVPDAGRFRDTLLESGVQVRDCTSFGLPHFVRIATRKARANQKLLDALRRARSGE